VQEFSVLFFDSRCRSRQCTAFAYIRSGDSGVVGDKNSPGCGTIACSLKINLLCYLLQFSAYFRSLYIPSFVIIGRVASRLWQVEICPDAFTVLVIGLNPTYSVAITLPMSPWRGHKNYNGDIYYQVFGRGEGTRSTECRPAVFRTGC